MTDCNIRQVLHLPFPGSAAGPFHFQWTTNAHFTWPQIPYMAVKSAEASIHESVHSTQYTSWSLKRYGGDDVIRRGYRQHEHVELHTYVQFPIFHPK